MLYLNFEQLRLSPEEETQVLRTLIERKHRAFLQACLKDFNIPNRTQIYKDFGYSYSHYRRNREEAEQVEREKRGRQVQHVATILEHSNINQWLAAFSKWYSVSSLQYIFRSAHINVHNLPLILMDETEQPYYAR